MALAPPWYSFGLSFLSRARSARSRISAEMAVTDLASTLRSTGVIRPPSSATATPISAWLETQDAVLRPHRIGGGNAQQRRRPRP